MWLKDVTTIDLWVASNLLELLGAEPSPPHEHLTEDLWSLSDGLCGGGDGVIILVESKDLTVCGSVFIKVRDIFGFFSI